MSSKRPTAKAQHKVLSPTRLLTTKMNASATSPSRSLLALVVVALMMGAVFVAQSSSSSRRLSAEDDGRRLQQYDTTKDLSLPDWTKQARNVWNALRDTDTPFFWYTSKSGGLTFQKICAQCLDLVSASPRGVEMGAVSSTT